MKKYLYKLDTYVFGDFYESEIVDLNIYDKDEAIRELVFINDFTKNEFGEFILKDNETVIVAKIYELDI